MGKIAFVFAGQGAQKPGMGKDLYGSSPAAKSVFDMAENLRPSTLALTFDGSSEELNMTRNTQPCLFAVDLACAAALAECGVSAAAVAGFSLGEIPAAAFCRVFTYEDAFRFVCARAEAMQICAEENPGDMFAVLKLPAEIVEEICSMFENCWPVNYNCPGQTVVACAAEISEGLTAAVAARGGRAMKLNVSGAFHSPFMMNASKKIAEFTKTLKVFAPQIPIFSNMTALPYGDATELLTAQIKSPVRWQSTIENMISDGFDTFVEVGAGKTLSGLIKKINGYVRVFNVSDTASLEATASALKK